MKYLLGYSGSNETWWEFLGIFYFQGVCVHACVCVRVCVGWGGVRGGEGWGGGGGVGWSKFSASRRWTPLIFPSMENPATQITMML